MWPNIVTAAAATPAATAAAATAAVRFPLESSALAPGMCAEVDVCFMPDSLGDYEDTFTVDTPAGKFEVHLTGRRPHPELTLPPVLEVRWSWQWHGWCEFRTHSAVS